jgi:hypothetical protein
MYAVEVVDATIPLWLKRVSSSMKVVEKKKREESGECE